MLFKDHLKIVTDAGAVLHLGWDYDMPYFLDPLNGVDIDLQTAQGINQTGTTVERQSVSGVSRTMDVTFWGEHKLENAKFFARCLPYFTKGVMYFGDKYFTRFVLQKTPHFSSYTPDPRCSLMLYSEKPFWYSLTAVSSVLGGFRPAFSFPVCYDSHIYGIKRDGTAAVLRNEGSLPVPFTAKMTCSMEVQHPKVVDLKTGDFIGFDLTLEPGDVLEIYRSTSDRLACTLTRAGVTTNIFYALDEDSTLTELQPGDNILSMQAENGSGYLQASVSFYPMEAGIIPEPL
nr:MAG TPA: tail protein [Caudoviricetes sp.]